jgi:heme exporter protein A
MTGSTLLETQNLGCIRNDRQLFAQLDIVLEAGEMLVVEGPNGCGKTSLLRILTGLRLADSGEILWRGQPIDRLAGDYYEQVNYYAYGDSEVGSLSAGQKRRLALARLLATDSLLWILDEPFTSLDKASMEMFAGLFEQHLQRDGVIVVTSHHDISLPTRDLQRLNLGAQA